MLTKHPHVWLGYGGAAGRLRLSAQLAVLALLKACPSPEQCGIPLGFGLVSCRARCCGAAAGADGCPLMLLGAAAGNGAALQLSGASGALGVAPALSARLCLWPGCGCRPGPRAQGR